MKEPKCDLEPNLQVSKEQLDLDVEGIDAYLEENDINAVKDESGLRYVVVDAGKNRQPDLCSVVAVTYTGSLMSNDEVFESTENPVSFPLRNLITGWQIGIPKVKQGGKVILYIPSVYAYGGRDVGDIPANSNLIFEIQLVAVQ